MSCLGERALSGEDCYLLRSMIAMLRLSWLQKHAVFLFSLSPFVLPLASQHILTRASTPARASDLKSDVNRSFLADSGIVLRMQAVGGVFGRLRPWMMCLGHS